MFKLPEMRSRKFGLATFLDPRGDRPAPAGLGALKRLWSSLSTQADADEQYLAEAVDACDLERRMRNLEEQARPAGAGVLIGWYPR